MRWFLLLLISASAVWAQGLVTIQTVQIGDAGNSPDSSTGFGSVNYEYRIGRHEITIRQYATFLNAVARQSDPYGLNRFTGGYVQGGTLYGGNLRIAGITRSGSAGSYTYSVVTNNFGDSGNRPIAMVRWFDAARFCNWLHNGATNGADTETGAYTLNGATSGVIYKNPSAKWWIPSEDEWYKAAYYNPTLSNGVGGYHYYALQSSNNARPYSAFPPGTSSPDSTIAGNFFQNDAVSWNGYDNGYAFQNSSQLPSRNVLTDVGSYTNAFTYYGTFDQAGNVAELTDGVVGTARAVRGGAWAFSESGLTSEFRDNTLNQNDPSEYIGFRVATSADAAPPTVPILLFEQPSNTQIVNDGSIPTSMVALRSNGTESRSYMLTNTGSSTLSGIVLTFSGSAATAYSADPTSLPPIQPGGTTTFSLSFQPSDAGLLSALLKIHRADAAYGPFYVRLSGYGLDRSGDFDSDGLNDEAEYLMAPLGFNWRSTQPSLVSTLFDNAAAAGLYTSNSVASNAPAFGLYTHAQYSARFDSGRAAGQADVTNAPASFSLFTQAQFDANRTAGQQDVIGSPMSHGLYTSNSIMDLRMGGLMVPKSGGVATVTFQPQTTTDLRSQPFTNNGAPITFDLPMPADKGFMRWKAE